MRSGSETEQPLQTLLNTVLLRPFGLNDANFRILRKFSRSTSMTSTGSPIFFQLGSARLLRVGHTALAESRNRLF